MWMLKIQRKLQRVSSSAGAAFNLSENRRVPIYLPGHRRYFMVFFALLGQIECIFMDIQIHKTLTHTTISVAQLQLQTCDLDEI